MAEEQVPELKNERREPGSEGADPVSSLEMAGAPERALEQAPEQAPEAGERLEGKYLELLQKTAPQASPKVVKEDEALAATAKEIGALGDEESKVTRLLELAEHKGVVQAVKVAYAMKDYYVLDRMHDELADKFYDALKAKGLAKSE